MEKKIRKEWLTWTYVFIINMAGLITITSIFPGLMKNNSLSLAGILWGLSFFGVIVGTIQYIRLMIRAIKHSRNKTP